MTVRRAAAWLGGSMLLAAWLAAAAAPSLAPVPRTDPQKYQTSEPDRAAIELGVEAERLTSRLNVVVAARPIKRNPFLFASRPQSAVRAPLAFEPVTAPAAAVVPVGPAVRLLGVAEDTDGSSMVRTAIVSVGGELTLAKQGELIGGRYRVGVIGADAIELEDTLEPRTIRIVLP